MSNDRFAIDRLLDFYGCLLTAKQQEICGYYYREDYTLQEIAEMEDISRAAVHDMLKRAREELARYEEKLHLADSFRRRMELYDKIRSIADDPEIESLLEECINTETEGGQYE